MGWNDDNRAALWSAPIQAGVGAGLMYGAAPLSALLAAPTGGLSLALAPLMWGAGAGLIGSGAGTAIGAGLDIAGSDPEKIYVSAEVQDIINKGNQTEIMKQLLDPYIQKRMAAPNPYAGASPYTSPIVGTLTGDASNVAAGAAQIPANFAEEIESWYKNRGGAQKQQWDDIIRMYQERAALADYANKIYLNAQQLESDVRRGNQENELDRRELSQARIRVGGKIGSKISGAIGGAFKPKFPETMEDLTKSSSGWLKGMRTSGAAPIDTVRTPIVPVSGVPVQPDVRYSVGEFGTVPVSYSPAVSVPSSVNYDVTMNRFVPLSDESRELARRIRSARVTGEYAPKTPVNKSFLHRGDYTTPNRLIPWKPYLYKDTVLVDGT